MENLWILTEERPKSEVIRQIINIVFEKKSYVGFFNPIKIIPLLDKNGNFIFTYKVLGIDSNHIDAILIKVVKGKSSFADFMVFLQDREPDVNDTPLLIIEETKTTDKESRNTGAGQRATKFPYAKIFYPDAEQIMLYSSTTDENESPTESNQFFTRLLITYGVKIHGKDLDEEVFQPFLSIDEIIEFKNGMRPPRRGCIPIRLSKTNAQITISGKLYKSGRLSHDPNIGQLTILSAVLRKLGWDGKIEIFQHGLKQDMVKGRNKFVHLANLLSINLQGLTVPQGDLPAKYWQYEMTGEKMVTILLHLLIEYLSKGFDIYSNHAGAERGYFLTRSGEQIVVEKYKDRDAYKKGDKSQIINLPDLVICDDENNEIINIEGERFENVDAGIKQLKLFDAFEEVYVKPNYPSMPIHRTVVLFGGSAEGLDYVEVSFILTKSGELCISMENAPKIFRTATQNLYDYHRSPSK